MKRFKLVALVLGVLTLSSCLDDNNVGYEEDTVAAAQFLNAIPESDGLIVALDNNQLNNLNYYEFFKSGDLLSYRRIFPGNRVFRVFLPEQVTSNIELLRQELSFTAGKFYSVFLAGNSEDDFEVFHVEDVIEGSETGIAKIRFVHLDADAPALDFGIEGEATPLAANALFKSTTAFIDIDSDQEYQFYVRLSDGSGEPYTFTFEPKSKDIYTIWVKDLISHGVILH